MKFTALQIAEVLGGEVEGNPEIEVYKLSKIEEGCEGSISFLANPKYKHFIYTTDASIVIVGKDFEAETPIKATLVKVEDAYGAFSRLLEFYNNVKLNKVGIEQPSFIAATASLGQNVYVGAFAYIGENVIIGENVKIYPHVYIGDNAVIGDNVTLFAGCKVYSETVIGKNCTLHSGVVLGADGFGFTPNDEGVYSKVPQIGNVILEDDVEIGANSTVDRATLGSTIIRKGVKLDNQIQIAHNVEIGKNTVIAAQTGIAGSTKIGESCTIGGQVGIVGHLQIGNRVRIQAQTGVGRNLKDDEVIQGSPALGYAEYNKSYVIFRKLPNLQKRIEDLEKKIK
ncbi:UDP-3-O-(3-hydroxymyristoyl)glucosamine N-acyltransferase [Capnocytophaga sp. oral taxon 878]|uniref:UDP-3-O-(3-hydroxymyristoyl)glucosamine N-acyltransferase n=1 Tax=Capnocytophaga sp. oral taxon 878 TaxID=1316596 RepID=UPI000D03200D|nr:UDP-3-O-(3-hydroxymyristoyl)glucosamine N-acyltransferase [Capnocytophaga sp. oral taxon 878]AVM49222.1 UDP-3-O-(3-hydroxymyristoyl)glucosamine N-acyltransferase [Capnocytophaga sp. oral taxon 878]